MPARRDDAPRTPAGRISRKFVPDLPTVDLVEVKRREREITEEELHSIADDLMRLKRAASVADEMNEALKPARAERNRLTMSLWAFHHARGSNLVKATGLQTTALYRVRLKQLGVENIPQVAGSEQIDWLAVRELATQRGFTPDLDAEHKLTAVVTSVAQLEGRSEAAYGIRDNLAVQAVIYAQMRQADVAELIGRIPNQISRMVREAGQVPQTIDLRGWPSTRSTSLLRRPATSYKDLVDLVEGRRPAHPRLASVRTDHDRDLNAKQAVLGRSDGRCESRQCTGMPPGSNRQGEPILDVDHIQDLALGGEDHPRNMIALCPNCHACKTRGDAEFWQIQFSKVALAAHQEALTKSDLSASSTDM